MLQLAYSTNAYRRLPLLEALDRIANLGYRGVELMADEPHLWPATATRDQLRTLRARLEDQGLQISNINAFMMTAVQDFWHPSWIEPDPAYRRLRVQHTMDALRLAGQLGAPSITTEPGGPLEPGQSRSGALQVFADGLREALVVAEEVGVSLLVEPEPDLLIENATQFLELAEQMDSTAFGLNFDIGHFFCVKEVLPQAIARLARHTRHFHIEDIAASRVHHHLLPGQGAIAFDEVFTAIAATAYSGWITVELYPYLDDPDAAGREALSYLTPLMSA
jgi:sugar phosphate isomerase/epimerase